MGDRIAIAAQTLSGEAGRMTGLTFDTGALIALERRKIRMRQVFEHALARRVRITVPADVVTEWWRGRSEIRDALLAGVRILGAWGAPTRS